MTDMEIMLELGMSRARFLPEEKKQLSGIWDIIFEIVVPQSANKRYKAIFSGNGRVDLERA